MYSILTTSLILVFLASCTVSMTGCDQKITNSSTGGGSSTQVDASNDDLEPVAGQ